ncbi:MEKHLA domain-containing protein [Pseudomonas izuensis]|uniref:MEKHLA domain-containing protein n=1 Tax=Pseudomonas izuensis TaxID=2684212 RepID=UPI00135884EA|nr:MEKHLA domain-containing protein [Pseudomonas izuensis]
MSSLNEFTALVQQLDIAYRHWTGVPLPAPDSLGEHERLAWLHAQAPYALLAHGTEADPLFYYANEQALASFKYPREQFIGMPSRFSASPLDWEMRQFLLEQVTAKGIAHGYSGYRVDRSGQAFMIHHGSVWTLIDEQGAPCGQAALFWPDPERVGHLA